MNPDLPRVPLDDPEQTLTALLLGELPEEEAGRVRQTLRENPELAALHERLKAAIDLVRQAITEPVEELTSPAPSRLSDERRQSLLSHFKTCKAPEVGRKRSALSWAIPLAIAAVLMGLLALPLFTTSHTRTKALASLPRRGATMSVTFANNAPRTANEATEAEIQSLTVSDPAVRNLTLSDDRAAKVAPSTPVPASGEEVEASRRFRQRYGLAPAAPSPPSLGIERYHTAPQASAGALVVENRDVAGASSESSLVKPLPALKPSDDLARAAGSLGGLEGGGGGIGGGVPAAPRPTASADEAKLGAKVESLASGIELFMDSAPVTEAESLVRQKGVEEKAVNFGALGDGLATTPAREPAPAMSKAKAEADSSSATALSFDISTFQEPTLSQGTGSSDTTGRAYFKSAPVETAVLGDVPQTGALFRSQARSESEGKDLKKMADLGVFYAGRAGRGLAEAAGKSPELAGGKVTNGAAPQKGLSAANTNNAPLDAFSAPSAGYQGLAADKEKADARTMLRESISEREKDAPLSRVAVPAPTPQPEVRTAENPFSTFSLNVSDVSFRLAAAALERGSLPEAASIRSEEFINAFDYRDPEPGAGTPLAFATERARYPFAHNRDVVRFSIKTASTGRASGRPLNVVLLLDNSGSMERADRVQIVQEALRVLAKQLQPQDKLSVVTFARTPRLWIDGVAGDQAAKVAEEIGTLSREGGTNLEEALRLAYQTASRHYQANAVNRVVLLTDGAANLGNVDPETLKQEVENHRRHGIALDCFGIGWDGYNDDLLEALSRNGDGRYGFLSTPEQVGSDFVAQLAGALQVAASDVKVQVQFNPQRVTAYRQIGYARHQLTKEQFRDNTVDAAEIGAAEAGNALYLIETDPQGNGPLATVRVRYKVPGTIDYQEHEWPVIYSGSAPTLEQSSPALRLSATAAAFSEWLASSPYGADVTPDRLLRTLAGGPEHFAPDPRPNKLEWMIRQAQSLSGK